MGLASARRPSGVIARVVASADHYPPWVLTDRARIEVRAGSGGNGAISFRREAHVPKGGPDGGDGGHGGDVVLRCDDSLRDLQAFRRRAHFRADRGGHGLGAQRHGADGGTLVIPVPPGTQVERWDGTRYDLVRHGQEVTLARGGSGGRGNTRFKGPTRQTPRLAEKGLPGEEGDVELHLKLLADVGLVGLPNAGKSSLLSRLTRAQPKVAAYPFTTLEPVLGTLESGERQLVIADIPGLIEGASGGAGLGHDFLAHVERTRLLVHVLDLAPLDGTDPEANHAVIEAELAEHDPRLAALPRILALSKADLVTAEDAERAAAEWRERLGGEVPVLVTSSATAQGLEDLGREMAHRVPVGGEAPAEGAGEDDVAEFQVFRPAARRAFEVEQTGEGEFRVSGEAIERLVARHDLENDEALTLVEQRLRRMGVIAALERAGFESGDDVEIAGTLFELDPGAPL
jgi:GTP-binding protein